jgi:putative ABC transport system permease protein
MPATTELLIALLLPLLCCLIALWQKQGITKELGIATIRSVLQISFLGFALKWIFAHPSLLITVAVGSFMTVNSALNSRGRVKAKYPGLLLDSLFTTALSIWPLAFIGSYLLKADPWWQAELFLPLLGMLLGNVLNGISLGVDSFTYEVRAHRDEILSLIALGATTHEATSNLFKRCIRTALTPMLNAMASMGLVSIPGMMTGQILAGQPPQEAAVVQIIMVLLLATGVYFGSMSGLYRARSRLFNSQGLPCF